MGQPLVTPGAVVLVAVDTLAEHASQIGGELERRAWIRQALIEELLRSLPRGRARRALRRLATEGRGVTESAADAVFFDLTLNGWLIPFGVHAQATWEVDSSRRGEIDGLWASLTEPERRAVQKAAQRTIAVAVAWSKKLRTGTESRISTSRSSKP
jgi:hypothetical protein